MMRHSELTDELQEQATLYAAGALPESERAAYVRHLEDDQCAVCNSAVREFQGVATLLAYSVPSEMPSPSVKTRLMDQARQTAPAPIRQERPSLAGRWLGWAASAVAVSALVALLAVVQMNRDLRRQADELASRLAKAEVELAQQRTLVAIATSPENRVIDLAGQGENVRARGRIISDRQRWLVYVSNLPKLPADKVYQLWFVPKSGPPVSAKVFTTEANFEVSVPPDLPALKAAAVTIEPAPGVLQPTATSFTLLGATE